MLCPATTGAGGAHELMKTDRDDRSPPSVLEGVLERVVYCNEENAWSVVRLEVEFQNANIYSLTAAYHFLDAQDQWMLKEGKEIDASRFDY